MSWSPNQIDAELWTQLPQNLHWSGPGNAWTEAARPGQHLHSFLEGPCFTRDGSLLVADVPYGRVFAVSSSGHWSVALEYDGQPHAVRPLPDGRFAIADFLRVFWQQMSFPQKSRSLSIGSTQKHFAAFLTLLSPRTATSGSPTPVEQALTTDRTIVLFARRRSHRTGVEKRTLS